MKKIDILKERLKFVLAKIRFRLKLPPIGLIRERLKDRTFKRNLIVGGLIAVVAVVVLARTAENIQKTLFKKKEAKKAPAVTFEEGLSPVKVLKIKKIDFKDTLPVMGNIKGFREVDLKFQVAGIIESINFEEGEKVQEGDIIASLVQKDALLKLKYANLELEKNQKLFDLGALGKTKIEQSKLEYESAKTELDKTNIYASSNGLLGSRIMDVGSYVTPNDKIGIFIDIDKVYAEFNVIEKDVPKMALRQKVDVSVDAFPAKSFSGQIDRIAPVIEGRSRTQTIKVELANKDGSLKPGMFARALIYTYEKKEALVIPSSALKKKEADYFVYVVHKEELKQPKEEPKKAEEQQKRGLFPFLKGTGQKKEAESPKAEAPKEKPMETGTVEIRKIKVGYMTQDLVEVQEGLKEDELVVVEVQEEFKDKAKVEIMEVQESAF